MKPSNVTHTHRPKQGRGAFVCASLGLASMGNGAHVVIAQESFVPSRYSWLDRAEDQVHPGEAGA